MRYFGTILITLLLGRSSNIGRAVLISRAAKDGGTLEYVFEAGEQNFPNAPTKEKAG
jgi:hypothetical protein